MKTIINKILLLVTLGVVLISCKKEGQLVTLGNGVPGVLTTSVSTVVLTKPNLNVEAVKASFTPADFGYSAAATNVLQIAKAGTSFTNAKEIILEVGSSSKSLTHLELNNMLLSMGFAPEVAGSVDFRIKTTIGTNVLPVYSNVKSVTITPFALIGILYMAGAHNGWAFAQDSVVSPEGDGIYSAIIQFKQSKSMFKLSKTKSWSNVYGSASEAVTSSLMVGPGDIPSALVGPDLTSPNTYDNYNVVANTNTLAITYELFTWGIIGTSTAGSWDNDTPMKYNNTTKTWSITTDLTAGVYKFRKNHGWAVNLGGSNGALSSGGSDIVLAAAGNYTITLNVAANTYTIVKN